MFTWKRVLISLAILMIVGAAYLWFFGFQTFFALQSRKIGREVPIVNSVPANLPDLTISQAPGQFVSFKGVEFEVPWDNVDKVKSRMGGGWALIFLQSGNSIILCVNKPKGFMNDLFRDKLASPELFTRLYGPDVLNSDYTLKKAIFETTPSDITLATSSDKAAGLGSVLMMKAIMPSTTDWAIYNIQTAGFRGFQLGDPRRRPRKMSLELNGDDAEIEINIEQAESSSTPAITQPELNRIIQSVRTTKNAQPSLTFNPQQDVPLVSRSTSD
jgi:hypothetical protein